MPELAAFPKGFFDDLISGRMALNQWLELAATLEVEGVELYSGFLKTRDSGALRELRSRIESLGLEMPMLCHSPDFTQRGSRERQAQVDLAREMIDATWALGGGYCRVLSGQGRPDVSEDEGIRWVVASIEALVPHAEQAGVVLTIENHYKDGTWEFPEFAQSRERFLRILREVPSATLQVQYDPSNAVVAGIDPYDLLDEVIDRVATMHASDRYLQGGTPDDLRALDRDPQHGYARLLQHGVIGEGFNDYDRIFSTLAGAGFDGWISIEDGEGETVEQGMENLRRSATFLKHKVGEHFNGRGAAKPGKGKLDAQ